MALQKSDWFFFFFLLDLTLVDCLLHVLHLHLQLCQTTCLNPKCYWLQLCKAVRIILHISVFPYIIFSWVCAQRYRLYVKRNKDILFYSLLSLFFFFFLLEFYYIFNLNKHFRICWIMFYCLPLANVKFQVVYSYETSPLKSHLLWDGGKVQHPLEFWITL